MRFKIVLAVVSLLILFAVTGFLFYYSSGHEDETSWGSWYQEYTAYYVDGGSAPLSIYHNEKEVEYIEYVLQATVDPGYSSEDIMFDLSGFEIQIKQDDMVLDTLVFSESKMVGSDDGQMILLTEQINSSVFTSLDVGLYSVSFIPDGVILIDDEETSLPSGASAFIQVTEADDVDDGGDNDMVINFESEISWS